MAIFVLMKSIYEREDQGVSCQEVVGTYAGAVKIGSTHTDDIEVAVENWVKKYLKHLDPDCDFAFKVTKCQDENVVITFDLLEPLEEGYDVFETIYVYPLKGNLYEENKDA